MTEMRQTLLLFYLQAFCTKKSPTGDFFSIMFSL